MDKIMRKHQWYIVGGLMITIVLLLAFGLNTLMLHQKLNLVIERSVVSTNTQLASTISSQIKSHQEFVLDLADTIQTHYVDQELLDRRSAIYGFDALCLIESTPQTPHVLYGDASLLHEIHYDTTMTKESTIGMTQGSQVFYTAPTTLVDGTLAVVVAIDRADSVTSLLHIYESWDYGVRLLVDRLDRSVVMEQYGKKTQLTTDEVHGLLEDVGDEGYPELSKNNAYIISCAPVKHTSWYQLSMVSKDVYMGILLWHIMIYCIFLGLEILYFVIIFKASNNDIKKQEHYIITDTLIDGYNREGFFKIAENYRALYGDEGYAVCHLDIYDFRRINELWGEERGNDILKFVYHKLAAALTDMEVVCRNGMDHFIMLLKTTNEKDFVIRVESIVDGICDEVNTHFYGYDLTFRIGGCCLADEPDLALAINNAVYVGKLGGKKNVCHLFNDKVRQQRHTENQTNELFDASIEHQDFHIYLQPKIGIDQSVEAEALVRWIHPLHGMIYPDQFIPQIEKNGKIKTLDLYMLEKTCALIAERRSQGKEVIPISLNVSRFTLQELGMELPRVYSEIKEAYHIPNQLIEIEVTETALIEGTEIHFIRSIIDELHRCGFKVALDDFGFAYSSLAVMKSLDVDTIKLDRSFFIDENERSRRIVASTIDLAHALGTKIVAEGIEDMSQVAVLWDSQCDYIQGYVYSKPLALDAFEKWRDAYEKQKHSK